LGACITVITGGIVNIGILAHTCITGINGLGIAVIAHDFSAAAYPIGALITGRTGIAIIA
jgi:hypothetical protein